MAVGVDGRWEPGLGDPTALGWVTVLAYAVSGALAARAALRARRVRAKVVSGERTRAAAVDVSTGPDWFWAVLSAALLLLAVNKQFDLQSWLTQVGRDFAKRQDGYEARRHYQFVFVVALSGIGAALRLGALVALRQHLRRIGIALLGFGMLVTFILARAASFHHVVALLHSGPLPLNWTAELESLGLIALNAWAVGWPLRLVAMPRTAPDRPQLTEAGRT